MISVRGIVASWMSLLKGARLINHDDRLKLYLKVGSMDDAVFDFYSLDPIDISQVNRFCHWHILYLAIILKCV